MMAAKASDSKRLAKNTLLLYVRTLLIMGITLFTSRIILDTLGVQDYGIYTIVGGFVSMFSIVCGTLVATTQRYLNFELGKKEGANPQKVFGAAMTIHIGLAIFIFFLFETFGLWFLNSKLNIPADRLTAANWAFQCSVAAYVVSVLSTPYNAVIVAHEKMSAFAYISLIEASLKLGIVYLLYISPFDKLVVYAVLLLVVAVCIRLIYGSYCKKHFQESNYVMTKDKALYKEMFSFAGMNFLGSCASILSQQGVDVIINLFFGVTLNAARGIANQVQHAIVKFVSDFMTALKPQITKEYASGNLVKSQELCFRGSKFSFFLLMFFAVPIYLRVDYILQVWLKVYPDFAPHFVQLTLALAMVTLLSNTLTTEILATGKLTNAILWIGGVRLLVLPLVYIAFILDTGAEGAYYVLIFVEIVSLFVRLIILNKLTQIEFVYNFCKNVILRVSLVIIPVGIICYLLNNMISDTLKGLVIFTISTVIINIIVIAIFGLTSTERRSITKLIITKIRK